jgi:hypothetical protein
MSVLAINSTHSSVRGAPKPARDDRFVPILIEKTADNVQL